MMNTKPRCTPDELGENLKGLFVQESPPVELSAVDLCKIMVGIYEQNTKGLTLETRPVTRYPLSGKAGS